MDLSYILNHHGEDRDQYFNAIAPPIIQSSNFAFKNVADLRSALADEYYATLYSRGNNPTVDILPAIVGFPKENFDATNPIHRTIRFYVGLEEPGYLLEDLKQALG